jgi:hypothetical protein
MPNMATEIQFVQGKTGNVLHGVVYSMSTKMDQVKRQKHPCPASRGQAGGDLGSSFQFHHRCTTDTLSDAGLHSGRIVLIIRLRCLQAI